MWNMRLKKSKNSSTTWSSWRDNKTHRPIKGKNKAKSISWTPSFRRTFLSIMKWRNSIQTKILYRKPTTVTMHQNSRLFKIRAQIYNYSNSKREMDRVKNMGVWSFAAKVKITFSVSDQTVNKTFKNRLVLLFRISLLYYSHYLPGRSCKPRSGEHLF